MRLKSVSGKRVAAWTVVAALVAVAVPASPSSANTYAPRFVMKIKNDRFVIRPVWRADSSRSWLVFGAQIEQVQSGNYSVNLGSFPGAKFAVYGIPAQLPAEAHMVTTFAATRSCDPYTICSGVFLPRTGRNSYLRVEIHDPRYHLTCWEDFRLNEKPVTSGGHAGCRPDADGVGIGGGPGAGVGVGVGGGGVGVGGGGH